MLPTEPIGSIPRPAALTEGIQGFRAGRISQPELSALYESAVQDTIQRLEATGSPVITDGEQAKHSFATYSIHGLENLSPDGVPILFADGHIRSFPRLTSGPFRYKTPADVYLEMAQRYAHVPLKQAVISASALSLLYPQGRIPGYSRAQYLAALIAEQEGEFPPRSESDLGCTPAQVPIAAHPTARKWTTLNSCRACSSCAPELLMRICKKGESCA